MVECGQGCQGWGHPEQWEPSNVACWFQQLQGVGPGCWSLKVTGAFSRAFRRGMLPSPLPLHA